MVRISASPFLPLVLLVLSSALPSFAAPVADADAAAAAPAIAPRVETAAPAAVAAPAAAPVYAVTGSISPGSQPGPKNQAISCFNGVSFWACPPPPCVCGQFPGQCIC